MSDLAQTLIYASQTMDIPSHRRAVEQAADEITRLQSEVERLRAQLADITGCACDSESLCKYHALVTTSGRATVLRKQAEAVEQMANQPKRWEPGELFAYAQRLRQQADNLENQQ